MKIEFHRTGGFAGPAGNKNLVLDSATFSPEDEQSLKSLVASAEQCGPSAPAGSGNTLARDAFQYRVTIDLEAHQIAFAGRMSDLSEPARKLIEWLERRK